MKLTDLLPTMSIYSRAKRNSVGNDYITYVSKFNYLYITMNISNDLTTKPYVPTVEDLLANDWELM